MDIESRFTSLEGAKSTLSTGEVIKEHDSRLKRMHWAAKEPLCKVMQTAMIWKLGRHHRNVSLDWLEKRAGMVFKEGELPENLSNKDNNRKAAPRHYSSGVTGESNCSMSISSGSDGQAPGDIVQLMTEVGPVTESLFIGNRSSTTDQVESDDLSLDAPVERGETNGSRRRKGAYASSRSHQHYFQDRFHRECLETVASDMNHSCMAWMFPMLAVVQLQKKLRIEQLLRRHPEAATKPLSYNSLVFIVGLPRTGSTFFHNLLGMAPNIRTVKNWEFRTLPHLPQKKRQVEAQRTSNNFYAYAKRMQVIHEVRAMDSDECCNGFVDCMFPEWYCFGLCDLSESYKMFRESSLVPMYRNFEKFLRVTLNSVTTDVAPTWEEAHRVVLKSPHHTFKLEDIATVFPGSTFVWIHRHPMDVVASCLQMNFVALEYLSKQYQSKHVVGKRTLDRLADCVRDAMDQRRWLEKNGVHFVDVHYSDLIEKPVETAMQTLHKVDQLSPTSFADSEEHHSNQRRALVGAAEKLATAHRKKKKRHAKKWTFKGSNSSNMSKSQQNLLVLDSFGINAEQVFQKFELYIEVFGRKGWQL